MKETQDTRGHDAPPHSPAPSRRGRRARLALAAATAVGLALSLGGCLATCAVPGLVLGTAGGAAIEAAGGLFDLASLDFDGSARVVVLDARDGTRLAEYDAERDEEAISEAFSGLEGTCDLADEPDAAREYEIEVYGDVVDSSGAGPDGGSGVLAVRFVTYEGSDVVELEVVPMGLTVHLRLPGGGADSLRSLAG